VILPTNELKKYNGEYLAPKNKKMVLAQKLKITSSLSPGSTFISAHGIP